MRIVLIFSEFVELKYENYSPCVPMMTIFSYSFIFLSLDWSSFYQPI